MQPVLQKKISWFLLSALVFLDAFLDVLRGAEGNPLWQPIVNAVGMQNVPLLVPPLLVGFYLIVKVLGRIVTAVDKTPQAEEIILTAFVLVYAVFDAWLLAVDFLNFKLVTDFRLMAIPLTAIGLAYGLWAEKKLKNK